MTASAMRLEAVPLSYISISHISCGIGAPYFLALQQIQIMIYSTVTKPALYQRSFQQVHHLLRRFRSCLHAPEFDIILPSFLCRWHFYFRVEPGLTTIALSQSTNTVVLVGNALWYVFCIAAHLNAKKIIITKWGHTSQKHATPSHLWPFAQ